MCSAMPTPAVKMFDAAGTPSSCRSRQKPWLQSVPSHGPECCWAKANAFADEIVPITIKGRKGDVEVTTDDEPSNTMPVTKARPAFKKEAGTVTAANASTISDGAAAVVLEHIVVTDVKKDFRTLGFRALDGTYFVKLDDPPASHVLVPIGVQDSDSEDEDTGEMKDFIIPDHEGEAFTFADPSIPWVKETHEAVRAFEQWTPTPEGQKIKDFIERMDRRTCVQEDNRQFEAGKCLNYVKPPL